MIRSKLLNLEYLPLTEDITRGKEGASLVVTPEDDE
jgi:hypothetical protein